MAMELKKRHNPAVIELQVEKVGQLFDTLDPIPFAKTARLVLLHA